MKRFLLLLAAIVLTCLFCSEASATGFGILGIGNSSTVVRQVNRGPLGFARNRSTVRVNNFGGFNNAIAVNNFNRGFGNNVAVFNNGFNGFNNVNIASFNRGFGRVNSLAVVNGGLPVTTINGFRVNAFGTSTVVDNFGNVFEADAFGNTVLRGNAAARGFSSFGTFAPMGFSSFGVSSGGFGIRSIGSCGF